MARGKIYTFQNFVLDPDNASLYQGQQQLRLRPKAFALLCYFVERPGQLVTKDELFHALWPNIVIDGATLTGRIRELRAALNDNTKQPRLIETVPTKGYRFIAKVQSPGSRVQGLEVVVSSQYPVASSSPPPTQSSVLSPQSSVLVGRETELTYLHSLLAKAGNGDRQVVFVTGEPGIGKTTLIETFLHSLASSVQRPASEEHEEGQSSKVKLQKAKVSQTQSSALSPQSLLSPNPRPPTPSPWIGRGQCVKQYGVDEAYLPVFEALGRLCLGENRERLLAVLRQYAPTWVVQMPGVLSPLELDALLPRVAGATRARMLRELAEALEVVTKDQTFVLWFDDLHDSDPSTLDLIAYLARRQHSARLLLIGTYRPAEALTYEHGLLRVQQELREHRHWQAIALECLDERAVERYLTLRLAGETTVPLAALAHAIHRRTEGNPLFAVSLVEDLQSQHLLVQHEEQWQIQGTLQEMVSRVPVTLDGTLAGQFRGLRPEEQTVLEAASVAGVHFTVPVVSAATGISPLAAEEICESLAQRERFICRDGVEEWPDDTLATRYRFRHALHQDVAYQRIAPLKRAHWHQQIGERREQAFAAEVETVAVELAAHFEQSRDYERAVRYLQQASTQAMRHSAYSEAIALATKGLAFLSLLPASPHRTQSELTLLMVLGVSRSTTQGYAIPEVGQACHRALELCRQADDDLQHFPILSGLFGFYLVSAKFQTARELGERLLRLAEQQSEPVLKLAAHLALGFVWWHLGELTSARRHFEQRHTLYSPQDHLKSLQFGHDTTVISLVSAAPVLWYLGYPERARRMAQDALALAERLAHPHTHAVTLDYVSQVFRERREVSTVQARMNSHLALCHEHDFREGIAQGAITRGWVLARQGQAEEAIKHICEGIAACEARGTQMDRSYQLAVLAETYAGNGQPDEGRAVLEDALRHVEKTGERYYEAEIYRLYGELLLRTGKRATGRTGAEDTIAHSPLHPIAPSSPEECFGKAIAIARHQHAKSLELRAVISLVRLRQQQVMYHVSRTKLDEAHSMLSEVYNWFTEGFETADLQEAKRLLEELRH